MATISQKTRLIVVFGGQSAERDVSSLTAAHVLRALDTERYQIEVVGINTAGEFVAADVPPSTAAEESEIKPLSPTGPTISLRERIHSENSAAETVVLPLVHGPLGEDGTLQGLLEMADVPYVGAGVLGSAVAMDKAMTKTVLEAQGIPQTKWASFFEHEGDETAIADRAIDSVGLPCFVKPANMGSSIGVSKASNKIELAEALRTAFTFDEVVVVEEAVTAREIEFAVLGNHSIEISVPGEIVPGADFYDYEDKYVDGAAALSIPAQLAAADIEQMKTLAEASYRALRVEGMARADFLFEENGRGPLLNELNTIPGFTPISMYPKLWEASGLRYSDLLDRLVELASSRHARRSTKRAVS